MGTIVLRKGLLLLKALSLGQFPEVSRKRKRHLFYIYHQQMLSFLLLDNCLLISYSFFAVFLGGEGEGMIFKTFVLCNVCHSVGHGVSRTLWKRLL